MRGRGTSPEPTTDEKIAAARVERLFALNAVLDDVLYGTYGVNPTSVEVHGRLCERLAPLTTPARGSS